jgi:hypothetical protein
MAVKGWQKLPTKSRTKCREMIFAIKRKKVYIVRCPKRATWGYKKLAYGHRCDEHKDQVEKLAKSAADAVGKLLKK